MRTELHQDSERVIGEVEELLERGDLHGVLDVLNARTGHRFTGVYRFDPPMLRNVTLFDRNNPDLRVGPDTPLVETYCAVVGATESPFATPDAEEDPRLVDHPARESTLSYCGVMLETDTDPPFGTLCHFDLVPQAVPEEEIPVLEAVASLVARYIRRQEG